MLLWRRGRAANWQQTDVTQVTLDLWEALRSKSTPAAASVFGKVVNGFCHVIFLLCLLDWTRRHFHTSQDCWQTHRCRLTLPGQCKVISLYKSALDQQVSQVLFQKPYSNTYVRQFQLNLAEMYWFLFYQSNECCPIGHGPVTITTEAGRGHWGRSNLNMWIKVASCTALSRKY